MSIRRYAIIPTHNRPAHLVSLIESLADQCDSIIVIDNASDPPVTADVIVDAKIPQSGVSIIPDDEQPPNLSRLWNIGLEAIAAGVRHMGLTQWDVAIFNDDAVIPAGWYDYVSDALRAHPTANVACTNACNVSHPPILKERPDGDITTRMCPWAFVVKGELGQRADERFRWWWGDTDWDWSARQNGGVLILPGYLTQNVGANSSTVGELAVQAGRDGQEFGRKWGVRPW